MGIPADHLAAIAAMRTGAAQYLALVEQMQAAHADAERYVQFGWTHSAVPDITDPQPSDSLDWYPQDREPGHALRQLFSAYTDAALPFRAKCDEWAGPDGKGWVLVVQTRIDGVVYQYTIPSTTGVPTAPEVVE